MARIRTIKPEFWKHEELSELPEIVHLMAAALLNYADDYGYFNANPKLVQAECCPLREPSRDIPEVLRSLQEIGYITLGTGEDGKRYGHIVKFDTHQRVSHPAKSKIADIAITWDASGNPPENSGDTPETLRPEQGTGKGNREQGTGKRARRVDSDFEEFYEAYPRKVGKGAAEKAWKTAKGCAHPTDIIGAVKAYPFPADKQFVPHPATWLNQKRWLDDPEAVAPKDAPDESKRLAEKWERKAAEERKFGPADPNNPAFDLPKWGNA